VRGRAFTVFSVADGGVTVIPKLTGRKRSAIEWHRFEVAERMGFVRPDVRPYEVKAVGASDFNQAYLTGILRAVAHMSNAKPAKGVSFN
ncbi:MAG: hypothetical protein ACR2OO_10375, partial [Thermomicrobiales bacterium]